MYVYIVEFGWELKGFGLVGCDNAGKVMGVDSEDRVGEFFGWK